MRITRPAQLLVAPVLLGVLALTGCNDAGSDQVAPVAVDSPVGTTAPTTAPDATTPAQTESDEEHYADLGAFPVAVDAPEQGGTYTAVVLAAGDQAELQASQKLIAKFAYTAAVSDTGCLQGLSQALGLDEGTLVSNLLFATPAQAAEFVATATNYDIATVGSAEVKAYCLD